MKKLLVLLIVLFTLSSNVVLSADYNKGLTAYNNGDYVTALREFKPLAEQGDSDSQYWMGYMYRKGLGVPQDDKSAVKWLRLSAEQGDSGAQFNLGNMYQNGDHFKQDNILAYMWLSISASNGYDDKTDFATKNMTSDELSIAQKLSQECLAMNNKCVKLAEKRKVEIAEAKRIAEEKRIAQEEFSDTIFE